MTFFEWTVRWRLPPEALAELVALSITPPDPEELSGKDKSEAYVQSAVRLEGASKGVRLWRNNVGAGARIDASQLCEACQGRAAQRMIRWGLANTSKPQNARIKSADLIGVRPVLITPQMVGTTVGQFVSRECKAEAWKWSGTEREQAQLAWQTLISSLGGDAKIVSSAGSL